MPKVGPTEKRRAVYGSVQMQLCDKKDALTALRAKKILGWRAEKDKEDFGEDFLLKDHNGVKIQCTNNEANRPFYKAVCETLTQEILRGKWKLNGQTIIVGKYGSVLNGQHELIALVLAVQIWESDKDKWNTDEPTIETTIVVGIDESDDVVNTIDFVKPRSLADVVFRSPYFADIVRKRDKLKISKMCEFGVRTLWARTGAGENEYTPRRTHSESLEFIERHPRLLECVRTIYKLDGRDDKIKQYINPGAAAALLYLMGSAATDREKENGTGYVQATFPSEKQIGWSLWKEAVSYWRALAKGDDDISSIESKFRKMIYDETGTHDARVAILVKGWNNWVNNEKITASTLKLKYSDGDADEYYRLVEYPTVGGIDVNRDI